MKVVCISDTHNRHDHLTSNANFPNKLPDGDLLIHAGDLTGVGAKGEVENVIDWMLKQASRFTHGIVFIAGNHDRSFDPKFNIHDKERKTKPTWLSNLLSSLKSSSTGVYYLENSSVVLGGLKIWGSPYSPWFHGDRWAFNAHRGPEIEAVWKDIPTDTDIVVTHTPISYKLDYIPRTQEYVGCEQLRTKVKAVAPILHVSGHIHESYGWEEDVYTTYVNASICDQYYEPTNKPFIFDTQEKIITNEDETDSLF